MRSATIVIFQMTDRLGEYLPVYSNYRNIRAARSASLKGDSTAQANEQAQLQFNQQLMSLFQTQFQNQTGILNFMKGQLEPMIQNPTGLDADTLATLRTQAKDSAADAYANAQKAYDTTSFARGGRNLPSGVDAQVSGAISGAAANQEATANQNIDLANEQLKQQNYWNSINALNGVAAQVNPLGYASAATTGGNTVANLSNAVTNSQQSGVLGGILGGVFGAGSALLGNPGLFGSAGKH